MTCRIFSEREKRFKLENIMSSKEEWIMLVCNIIQFGTLFVDELIFLKITIYLHIHICIQCIHIQKCEGQPECMNWKGLGNMLCVSKECPWSCLNSVDLIPKISNTRTITRKHKRGHWKMEYWMIKDVCL